MSGCAGREAEPGTREGAEGVLARAQEQPTLLGSIAKDWQVYTILVMMLMTGLVALAYVAGNAFSLPDLKAWADVELGEIFASALLLILIIGILLFVDGIIRGMLADSFRIGSLSACDPSLGGYCPANVANAYINGYLKSAGSLYRDITINNIEKAREATAGGSAGLQDQIYAYLSFSFRYNPDEMVWVETYDQLLQNLGNVLGALATQSFLIKFVTLRLAPLAIFLGIIFRSFFLTRKLGGLLLAFGIGFMLVYPMNYALAWFTLDSMIYGGQKAPTGPVMPCPEVCVPGTKIVDFGRTPYEEVTMEDVREAVYQNCLDNLEREGIDDTGRSKSCLDECEGSIDDTGRAVECMDACRGTIDETGRDATCMADCIHYYQYDCFGECETQCIALGYTEPFEMTDPEVAAAWNECMAPCVESKNCIGSAEESATYCRDNVCGTVPGFEGDVDGYCSGSCDVVPGYAGDKAAYCQDRCPPMEGFGGSREDYCNAETDNRVAEMGPDSRLSVAGGGLEYHSFGYCEQTPCGFPVPYYRKECITYQGTPNICNTRPFEADDPAYAEFTPSELGEGCPEECRTLAPMKSISIATNSCNNVKCSEYYTEEELCQKYTGHDYCAMDSRWDRCKKREIKCPSQCMWISTSGRNDSTCPKECQYLYPGNPQYLWDHDLSSQTCVYIVPDIVFDHPELCSECAFVIEKGFAMKQPMILDCTSLCGAPSGSVMSEDPATMTNNIKGMVGPSELISVSKLMVPAYVLPMFALAVTLMFVLSLSPMLGGDMDIPGMLRMIQ